MAKTRMTLTIDEDVLRAVKVRAARAGIGESELIERAVRRDLGFDLPDRLWERADLSEEDAISSRDPDDDYLIALSAATRSVLVTGDADLIELRERIPVMTPRDFLDSLDGET